MKTIKSILSLVTAIAVVAFATPPTVNAASCCVNVVVPCPPFVPIAVECTSGTKYKSCTTIDTYIDVNCVLSVGQTGQIVQNNYTASCFYECTWVDCEGEPYSGNSTEHYPAKATAGANCVKS